jgi:hypothetical protein
MRKEYFYQYNQQEYIGDNLLYQQIVETKKLSLSTSALTTSIVYKESSQVLGVIGFLLHKIGRAWGLNMRV